MAKATAKQAPATRERINFTIDPGMLSKADDASFASKRTRSKSAERQAVDALVANLTKGEPYSLPVPGGEKVRKAFLVHLRNSVDEQYGLGLESREDGDTVYFRMKDKRKRNASK